MTIGVPPVITGVKRKKKTKKSKAPRGHTRGQTPLSKVLIYVHYISLHITLCYVIFVYDWYMSLNYVINISYCCMSLGQGWQTYRLPLDLPDCCCISLLCSLPSCHRRWHWRVSRCFGCFSRNKSQETTSLYGVEHALDTHYTHTHDNFSLTHSLDCK